MKFQTITLAVGLVATLFVSGCDSEDHSLHDVSISWSLAGSQVCSAIVPGGDTITFDNVIINVFEQEGDSEPIQEPITVACDDYEYTIARLERGTYHVRLDAMADYDGEYLAFYQATKNVTVPGDEDHYEFSLMQARGSIHVTWGFSGGLICGVDSVNEVDKIDINLVENPVKCTNGEHYIEDLEWNANYSVVLDGLDDAGEILYSGSYDNNPFEVKPGQTVELHVILQ